MTWLVYTWLILAAITAARVWYDLDYALTRADWLDLILLVGAALILAVLWPITLGLIAWHAYSQTKGKP